MCASVGDWHFTIEHMWSCCCRLGSVTNSNKASSVKTVKQSISMQWIQKSMCLWNHSTYFGIESMQRFSLFIKMIYFNFRKFHGLFLCNARHGILNEIDGFHALELLWLLIWTWKLWFKANHIVFSSESVSLCANKFGRPFCMSKRQLCGQSGVYVCISFFICSAKYIDTRTHQHTTRRYRWVHMYWKWKE